MSDVKNVNFFKSQKFKFFCQFVFKMDVFLENLVFSRTDQFKTFLTFFFASNSIFLGLGIRKIFVGIFKRKRFFFGKIFKEPLNE